ncbi:hypothetical protein PR048_013296 [Dryococelus australis]|uniref:DUF4371 domain-containing protein n=1 Tax=Dryococelus australis TaxID=614101 RepID=A0ABQ9HRX9_9NEOP|nr:hypothetical protein PR048_013296 [Dryococelus australis]
MDEIAWYPTNEGDYAWGLSNNSGTLRTGWTWTNLSKNSDGQEQKATTESNAVQATGLRGNQNMEVQPLLQGAVEKILRSENAIKNVAILSPSVQSLAGRQWRQVTKEHVWLKKGGEGSILVTYVLVGTTQQYPAEVGETSQGVSGREHTAPENARRPPPGTRPGLFKPVIVPGSARARVCCPMPLHVSLKLGGLDPARGGRTRPVEHAMCSRPKFRGTVIYVYSHVNVMPGDADGWLVFSEISLFPSPGIPALLLRINHISFSWAQKTLHKNIPIHGHRDDSALFGGSSDNTGSDTDNIVANDENFRANLGFRTATGDTYLENNLQTASSTATYIGKNNQNDLSECCAEEIRENIVERTHEAPWFSIIFDETTDVSNQEQMDNCPVMVSELKGCNRDNKGCAKCQALPIAESLSKQLFEEVKICCGLQEFCRENEGFELSVAFVKHDGKKSKMGSFNLAATFQKFAKWKTSPETASKALTHSEFILSVFAMGDVLMITHPLSRLLLSPTLDLVYTTNSIRNVLTVLEKKRNEVEYTFHKIFVKAESVATEMEVAIVSPRISSKIQEHRNKTLKIPLQSLYTNQLDEIFTDLRNRLSEEVKE